MRCSLPAIALYLALVAPASAKSFAPRTDLEIVALDIQTGAMRWSHKGAPLGNAHYELYPGVLAVYPHYDHSDTSKPMLLDPATGKVVRDTRDPKRLVAKSAAQWMKAPVTLANGWRLDGFEPGNTKELELVDRLGRLVWRIEPAHYPEFVRAYKDVLLVAYGYLTDEAIVFGYKAGAKRPTWTIDFNKLLGKPTAKKSPKRLGRVTMQVIGDVLYAQTGEHVFAIAPATGKILWRLDAAAALGIAYEPDLYGGALDVAVFARDRGVLVVAFEKRILAVRAATGALLWSLPPDTFPHTAFPLAANGLVYITAGPKRGKPLVTASRGRASRGPS